MHVPASIRQDSLYFTYPEYPFVRPPELQGEEILHDVAIVGGGPVGLACALEFARFGIRPVVLETKRTLSDGSRALSISRRSQNILAGLGAADAFQAKALAWTHGRSFYRDTVIFRLVMPHDDDERFGPMSNLQQCHLEKILVDRAIASGNVEMRWQSRVNNVNQDTDGAVLSIDTPDGPYRLLARHVIAADGARSAVREALGLQMKGTSYEGLYLIADIRIDSTLPLERHAWFDPPSNPGSTMLMHKQPDGLWRIDYQLLPEQDPGTELKPDRIKARIASHLEMIGETAPWELDWFSLYRAHCICLDDYRHGPVLFAGDAAHLVPIFGVRGLNSGFADANNLGWKLAAVLSGDAGPVLLDSYSAERRPATLEIFRQASKSTAFMTPPTRGHGLMRTAALSLALSEQWAGELANPRQSQPYDYVESPLNAAGDDDLSFATGPRAGAPLLDVRLADGGFLLDRVRPTVIVLCFVDSETEATSLPFPVIRISREPGANKPDWISDPEERVYARYGAVAGSCYLIRPDGHVAGRWRSIDGPTIKRAAERLMCRTS